MVIRPLQPGDEEGVIQTIRAVYDEFGFLWDPEGYHADLYNLQTHFQPPHQFWVAVDPTGQVQGTIGLEIFDPIPGPPGTTVLDQEGHQRIAGCDAELVRLYVHPKARRQGLGQKLTQTVVDHARQNHVKRLEIWSDVVFTEAHRLYARFGAVQIGHRKETDPEEFEEYGLMIELES